MALEGYLIDTNIFLEILLGQSKKEKCKAFLEKNQGKLFITDFSLHSIGVILIRSRKAAVFEHMGKRFESAVDLIALDDSRSYSEVVRNSREYRLDFDDAYQVAAAETYGLTLVTLDKHFKKLNADLILIL